MIKHLMGRSPMANARSLAARHKSPTGSGRDTVQPYVDGLHPPRLASGDYTRDKQVDESDICELPGWGENQFLAWQGSRSSLNGFSSSLDLEDKRAMNNFNEGFLTFSCSWWLSKLMALSVLLNHCHTAIYNFFINWLCYS